MIALTLLACGGGDRHPSVVEDLRILSIVADPPEAAPGESVDITVLVADPKLRGSEVLIWTCGMYEGECAESLMPFADWPVITTLEVPLRERELAGFYSRFAEQTQVTRTVPEDTEQIFEYLNPIPVALYALACEPGLCPIIEDVRAAQLEGFADSDLLERLSDPSLWMYKLPMDGVSLAGQQLVISSSLPELRNENPIFEARFPEAFEPILRVPAGGELEVAFFTDDPNAEKVYGYAYTTIGAFEERRVKEEDNGIRNWLQVSGVGEGRLYMVFEDRDGGSAIWTQQIEVY
ncbi:MAG: hypothetical protein P8R54_01010 [Myxococcota bacterium]|nr:hypothetical protein [Myxococcota bacterium]